MSKDSSRSGELTIVREITEQALGGNMYIYEVCGGTYGGGDG